MSWTVDGHTYHDYGEYQSALQRKASREATERAGQAQAELSRYQQRLRQQQDELERTQGDLARQRGIGEQMRQEVRGLEREQRNLADAQVRFERDANARLGQMRSQMQTTDAKLTAAEEEHRKHVAATQRAFEQTNQALRAGLAEAERRRQESETRLTAAVAEVDRKVEHDRRERLSRHANNLDQAREQIKIVDGIIDQLAGKLGPLNLEDEEHSVRIQLQSAQGMVQQGNASAAMSQSETAFSGARALAYKAERRRGELSAAAGAVANRIEAIRDCAKPEALDTYFKAEKAQLLGYLTHVENRIPHRYLQYSRMEDDLREDERILERLEEEARTMVAMCPTLAENVDARKQRVTQLVRKIASSYGGGADIKAELAEPSDVKSPLVVNCTFAGGAKIRIEAGVDGEYHVDAAGHGSQDECNRRASELVRMLGTETHVSNYRTLAGNPEELPRQAPAAGQASQDVGKRLGEIGKQL